MHTQVILALTILLAAPASAPQDGPGTYLSNMDKGMQAYLDRDYRRAIEYFERSLTFRTHRWRPTYNIACCYALLEKPQDALRELEKAVHSFLGQETEQTELITLMETDTDLASVRVAAETGRRFVEVLDDLQVHHYTQKYLALEPAYELAVERAAGGHTDLALGWLMRAIDSCWGARRVLDRMREDLSLQAVLEGPALDRLRDHANRRRLELIESSRTRDRWIDWVDGHRDVLTSVDVSPTGASLLTASRDRTARIWDLETLRMMRPLRGHLNSVLSARYSPDGSRIVTASNDRTARVWDAATGEQLQVLLAGSVLQSACFSPDGRLVVTAGMEDWTATVWDVVSGEPVLVLGGAQGGVWTAVFSPDGRKVVAGGVDSNVRVYDSESGELLWAWTEPQGTVRGLEFWPQGDRLLVTSYDGILRIYDFAPDAEPFQAELPELGWLSSRIASSGGLIASATDTGECVLWSPDDGMEVQTLSSGSDLYLMDVAFGPDDVTILAAGWDYALHAWDVGTAEPLQGIDSRPTTSLTAAFAPDGERLVTLTEEGALEWDLRDLGKGPSTARPPRVLVEGRSSSEVVWSDASIHRWGAARDSGARAVLDVTGALDLYMSPGWDRVYSIDSASRQGVLWEAGAGRPIGSLEVHAPDDVVDLPWQRQIRKACFSRDGERLATVFHGDSTARTWNARSGARGVEIAGHLGEVLGAAFDPSGRRLATAGMDGTVRVWDVDENTELRTLRVSDREVACVAFGADLEGSLLAAGDFGARVTVWNWRTGEQLARPLSGHDRPVTGLAFSADGSRLASTSLDETVRVWDLESGSLLATLVVYPGGDWLWFTPELYFEGSPAALERSTLVFKREAWPLTCYTGILQRPDLLRETLRGMQVDTVRIDMPPAIEVLAPSRAEWLDARGRFELVVQAIDRSSSAIATFEVRQDAKPWPQEEVSAGVERRGEQATWRSAITLPDGLDATTIEVRAISRQGTISRRVTLELRRP